MMFRWYVPGLPVQRRLPAAASGALGFGGYMIAAMVISLAHDGPLVGIALLVTGAGLMGWWTTVPGAVWIGGLGWFFYSGFVTHAHGQLGVVGGSDVAMAGLLLGAAMGAAAVRPVVLRRRARIKGSVTPP
ncbi:hypothetical protein JJ691_21130 [Kutzneria sp. CA-103260]|nr:hypothetical protein JJ691_21130 [Kutzneria sp. CA-103260]